MSALHFAVLGRIGPDRERIATLMDSLNPSQVEFIRRQYRQWKKLHALKQGTLTGRILTFLRIPHTTPGERIRTLQSEMEYERLSWRSVLSSYQIQEADTVYTFWLSELNNCHVSNSDDPRAYRKVEKMFLSFLTSKSRQE
jgi:hypothetical protein